MAAWEFMKDHWIAVLVAMMGLPFFAMNPLAGAGWLLLATMAAMLWQLGRRLVFECRKVRSTTELHMPGGIVTIRGMVTPEQAAELRVRWARSGAVGQAHLPDGVKWVATRPAPAGPWTETDGIHPPLPPELREAWNAVLTVEQARINAEGDRYKEIKDQYRRLVSHDAGPDNRERMIRRMRGIRPGPGAELSTLRRLADGLEAISPEGARLGELLYRGSWVPSGRRPAPEIPRTWVPILDRSFSLLTDCRYHHVAEHGIEELRDGFVVRRCGVCEPSTYWIERA